MEKMYIIEVGPDLGDCTPESYRNECDKLEECYTELEKDTPYCVTVRRNRKGEASGLYCFDSNGGLQLMNRTFDIPEDLQDLRNRAFDLFCNG
jgi:hypothetical protein